MKANVVIQHRMTEKGLDKKWFFIFGIYYVAGVTKRPFELSLFLLK
ncbi:hypothetical protein J2S08_002722 [Bacillus chungangensis]|uniref:Uncharacterized protein n=1 Tax=Bacillus chungangensis TaxID=587633 RepID=A0ABT9WUG9_9BACI|nr:hypothetical protein [Bacillus chungangensis]